MDEDVAAITRATKDWGDAFKEGDLHSSLAIVSEDVVVVPPNQPEVVGHEAFEAWARGMIEALEVDEVNVTVSDVRIAGDWAVSYGTWHMRGSTEGAPMSDTTRYVVTWERQPDRSWKVVHDLWNSSLPA
jgi:uncharacterized protein (TIGR02246 family)